VTSNEENNALYKKNNAYLQINNRALDKYSAFKLFINHIQFDFTHIKLPPSGAVLASHIENHDQKGSPVTWLFCSELCLFPSTTRPTFSSHQQHQDLLSQAFPPSLPQCFQEFQLPHPT